MKQKLRLKVNDQKLLQEEEGPVDDGVGVGVDSQNVAKAVGVNNDFIRRVRFTFGQADYKRTVLSLSDEDDPSRFDIPEELVSKQSAQFQFRLDMVDFQYKLSPFSFSFASTRTGQPILNTFNQTFVFQKKFIQIDMNIA